VIFSELTVPMCKWVAIYRQGFHTLLVHFVLTLKF
jgi:hypothetical protein